VSGFDPDFAPALVRPSANFGDRKPRGEAEGIRHPDTLILHYTGMASGKAALDWLCNPESGVSSHYFIDQNGLVTQMVPEEKRAWHAGKSFWKGDTDINSASIGIEIDNPGHEGGCPPFSRIQMQAVIRLCRDILARNQIPAERVLAHSDVAPGRKRDPGEWFDWKHLHQEGIGHWVEPVDVAGGRFFQEADGGQPVEALQTMLSLYGYDTETDGIYGAKTKTSVAAFQRHFRPARVDGIADASTIATLHKLLTGLPTLA